MTKRIAVAAAVLAALALPAAAAASPAAHYQRAYHAVALKLGTRAPGRNILRDGLSTGGPATTRDLLRSIGVLDRMLGVTRVIHRAAVHVDGDGDHDGDVSDAPPASSARAHARGVATPRTALASARSAAPVARRTPSGGGGGLSSVPGVPAGFAACVALHESTNGTNPAAHGNVYGIIPASGYDVSGMSLAGQKAVFARLYAQHGAAPWSRYDGC